MYDIPDPLSATTSQIARDSADSHHGSQALSSLEFSCVMDDDDVATRLMSDEEGVSKDYVGARAGGV